MPSAIANPPAADPSRVAAAASKNISVHYEKLDHLRFLAAFLILLHHGVPAILCAFNAVPCDSSTTLALTANLGGLTRVIRALILEGHSAVALFITLSGFLFARICGTERIHYGKFVLNRVLRIYPMYLCALLLATYLSPGNNGLLNILTSVCCLQNLASPVTHQYITPPLWTVAVEFQFYLLFPFLLGLHSRKGVKPILLLLLASIVVKAIVYFGTGTVRDLSYQTLFGRIDQFIIGMLAGWYFPTFAHRLRSPVWLALAAFSVIAVLSVFHLQGAGFWGSYIKSIWIVFPAIESLVWVSLITAYCASAFSLPRMLSKVLCSLGAVSFSMYICHYGFAHLISVKTAPLLREAFNNSQHWLHPLVSFLFQHQFYGSIGFVLLVVLPVVVLFSTLTYHAIEKPFMDMRVKYKV